MNFINISERKPLAYKIGLFDGQKSDLLLVQDRTGNYHIAEMYEGVLDGSEFCDFYDNRDYEIKDVVCWTVIDKN